MTIKVQNEINRIRDALVKNYQPEKIILFGSYAWGKPRNNSDLDFLIVKNTNKENLSERMVDALMSIPEDRDLGIDILVHTPKEIVAARKQNNIFLQEIEHKGKVVYER